ncbi:MAG: polysaccharide pyruvyl transferase family protein [Nitriliruptoraceae bacterium]|nr:polysaccharide pyruvyl transferase family protein [Nitriliruptoraceae bacterium]
MSGTVGVAAWVGAGNLGDELLLRSTLRELDAVGLEALVLSLDAAATERLHGVQAVHHLALARHLPALDGLVFGGGGLIQDRSSVWSPLYQGHRPLLARAARLPVVGVGLGAEHLRYRSSRSAARLALGGSKELWVRDEPSARVLKQLGLGEVGVAADLAFLLPTPRTPRRDDLVVSLVGSSGGGGLRPTRRGRVATEPPPRAITQWAAFLDEAARRTSCAVRFVAMDLVRDTELHERVAARMQAPTSTAPVGLSELPEVVGGARAVIAARYHACVLAVLAGRPTLAFGYAPKIDALARAAPGSVARFDHDVAGVDAARAQVGALLASLDTSLDPEQRERLQRDAARQRSAFRLLRTLIDA